MSLSRRSFLAGVAAAPILAACGGGDDEEAAPSTTRRPTTTTTESTTTTTTAPPPPPPPVAPLTGEVWAGDPAILSRPAVVVKIDNAEGRARPQFGLNQADIVYEERVEGSVTRLAAVFQSNDADPVGPVRSFRTTDLDIVANLNWPLFAWSGANGPWTVLARSGPLTDVGYEVAPSAYYRDRTRRAPHNLMTSTPHLRLASAGVGPPPQLFTYRAYGTPAGGVPVNDVRVSYGGGGGDAPVNYRVDPGSGTWFRFQKDTPHVDAHGIQVNPANVIIQFVGYTDTGVRDVSGSGVPKAELVGYGPVWVLTAGQLIEGTWQRPDGASLTTLLDAAGQPIALSPGRTWIALPAVGAAQVLA